MLTPDTIGEEDARRLGRALRGGPGAGPIGGAVGPWLIDGELGRGGMGVVLRARRARDGAPAALKVLLAGQAATPTQRERFAREAEALQRLDHPGIVRLLGHGASEEGLLWLAMALLPGEPTTPRRGGP